MRSIGGAAIILVSVGCVQPRVRYHGCEHPQAVAHADEVTIFGGRADPPHRHVKIGTVVATWSSEDEDELVARVIRRHAARVGGTAIHHVDCETRWSTDEDGDMAAVTTCGAHVLRAMDADDPVNLAHHGDELMELEKTRVALASTASAPTMLEEKDHAGVGIVEAHPFNHAYFGETAATCVGSCARSTLSRAIRIAAAKRGAVAIAEVECDLDGAVSRCTASLVGPELDSVVAPSGLGPRIAADD